MAERQLVDQPNHVAEISDDLGAFEVGVPGLLATQDQPVAAMAYQTFEHVGRIVEVYIAVDLFLVVDDVNFSGGEFYVGQPGQRVVSCPVGLGRDNYDVVALSEICESRDRAGVGRQVSEDRGPMILRARPGPELTHVGESGAVRQAVPAIDRGGVDRSAELGVMEIGPAAVEVGDDTVEVNAEAESAAQ